MRLFLILLALISVATAQTPLDLLQPRAAPVQAVSLSGLSPTSAHAIAAVNENLTAWKDRPLADLGKFFSGTRKLDNGRAGVPDLLINFTMTATPLPQNISAEVGNLTPIETENGGLIFI